MQNSAPNLWRINRSLAEFINPYSSQIEDFFGKPRSSSRSEDASYLIT